MAATCLVSARDFAVYFDGTKAVQVKPFPVWSGAERRGVSVADRRANAHDRRWEKAIGRRRRLADRRKAVR